MRDVILIRHIAAQTNPVSRESLPTRRANKNAPLSKSDCSASSTKKITGNPVNHLLNKHLAEDQRPLPARAEKLMRKGVVAVEIPSNPRRNAKTPSRGTVTTRNNLSKAKTVSDEDRPRKSAYLVRKERALAAIDRELQPSFEKCYPPGTTVHLSKIGTGIFNTRLSPTLGPTPKPAGKSFLPVFGILLGKAQSLASAHSHRYENANDPVPNFLEDLNAKFNGKAKKQHVGYYGGFFHRPGAEASAYRLASSTGSERNHFVDHDALLFIWYTFGHIEVH